MAGVGPSQSPFHNDQGVRPEAQPGSSCIRQQRQRDEDSPRTVAFRKYKIMEQLRITSNAELIQLLIDNFINYDMLIAVIVLTLTSFYQRKEDFVVVSPSSKGS